MFSAGMVSTKQNIHWAASYTVWHTIDRVNKNSNNNSSVKFNVGGATLDFSFIGSVHKMMVNIVAEDKIL